jgi:hypothetical protein
MSNQQFMPTINLSPLFERKSDAWAAVDLTVFGLALGQSTNSVTLNLVDNQFPIFFYVLWLSYIFYHNKCRVYSGLTTAMSFRLAQSVIFTSVRQGIIIFLWGEGKLCT